MLLSKKVKLVALLCGLLLALGAEAEAAKDESTAIPYFTKPVYFTNSNSDTGLLRFLSKNTGRIVYIDNTLDISQALEVHIQTLEACATPDEALMRGEVDGVPLPIPEIAEGEEPRCQGRYLVLHPNQQTLYLPSSGGMGEASIRFKGFFDITTTYHSGPSIHYHLSAVSAPFEVRQAMQEKIYQSRQ